MLTEYSYDLDGNIQNKKVTNNKNEKQESTYSYDAENKLNSITTNQYTNGTSLTASSTSSFSYDPRGNQIGATKKTTKNGQTVVDSNTAYKYNELDQLTEFTATNGTKTAYAYYADGLRKSKTISNVTTGYYYDGNHVIIETTGGTFSSRNILGNSQIGRQTPASTYYYLYNGHGDVMNVVDSTGTVQNNYDYEIYGMGKVATENGLKNPVRYAGEYFDEESGLYYLRGRYYSPDTMRFISEDTNKGKIGEPLTLNLYTYCEGNPVRYVDRDGHVRSDATANGGGGGGDVPSGGGGAGGVLWGIYEGGKVLINKAGNAVSNGAQKVKDALSKGSNKGIIQEMTNEAFKYNKIFSRDHINGGFDKIGNKEKFIDSLRKVINDVDSAGKLTEGNWRIRTEIDGMKTEISTFIKDGKLINVDAWPGWSNRQLKNVIEWP